jgi:tetraacyldisaccharide 4'-kinase
MLPEGRLREPLKGIERADLAIINKIADEREADSIAGELTKKDIPFVKAGISKGRLVSFSESETEPSSSTLPPRAIAFAGIGSPESFAESIRELGIEVVATRFFRDHEHYDKEKLMSLADDAARNNCCLITTEKDYFRLLGTTEHRELLCGVASYYLKIEPEIHEGEDILKNMLMRVVTKGERTCGRNFA